MDLSSCLTPSKDTRVTSQPAMNQPEAAVNEAEPAVNQAKDYVKRAEAAVN